MLQLSDLKIAIIGLGSVGLPLAVKFGKKVSVIGFDIHQKRIDELKSGQDHTLEVSPEELKQASKLSYSADLEELKDCNFFIVTVPTPVDAFKQPDLTPLIKASTSIAKVLKKGDVVVYESTVYPGVTEEVCIPVLEKKSGLIFNQDFFAGYSPERINLGDKINTLTKIKENTRDSTPEVTEAVDNIYSSIVAAGTYKVTSIKVAEAAKVIENTQRDLNITLANELSVIFDRLDIDTLDVFEATGSKLNFLPFRPGLEGGNCIGVNSYYLTHKAQFIGLHLEIILAARRLNDGMGEYVTTQLIKEMLKKCIQVVGSKTLVIGLSFKENCPDISNTKIIDMVKALKEYDLDIEIYDLWRDINEARYEYGLMPITQLQDHHYDAVILAVTHDEFKNMSIVDFKAFSKENYMPYDLKYILDKESSSVCLWVVKF